jgi:hypothetical protein
MELISLPLMNWKVTACCPVFSSVSYSPLIPSFTLPSSPVPSLNRQEMREGSLAAPGTSGVPTSIDELAIRLKAEVVEATPPPSSSSTVYLKVDSEIDGAATVTNYV